MSRMQWAKPAISKRVPVMEAMEATETIVSVRFKSSLMTAGIPSRYSHRWTSVPWVLELLCRHWPGTS